MKIATYNVNGINARLPVLLRWLEKDKPDVVCLQELKAPQEKFPEAAIMEAGYHAIWHGQKSWNGVAILSRSELPDERIRVLPGDTDDLQSRYIEAEVNGIIIGCLYLPNGNPLPGPKFDYKLLGKEIDEGLYFESSIPEGYGLGSSGALVAALYHRYAEKGKTSPRLSTSQLDIPNLKRDLAILESWFHGTSSGIDPLICYMRNPLLIKEDQTILPIGIPRYNLTPDDAIFLINSGKSVKTAPLVDQFIKDCENPEFKNRIINEYIPLNNSCIESLVDADIEKFTKKVYELSKFQATYFKRMIPPTLEMEWMFGITSGKFMLKLCGSGGGGFILGFTHHYKEVRERFSEKGLEIIPVYQYGGS